MQEKKSDIMSTIIISDIDNKSESVVPYGLNIVKFVESEPDVLHIADRRMHQGKISSFSD
jgi:hypothetical protein